jgi:5-methyltetrahydropteroyltriglutamate--homocysteine methyltransferase
VMRPSAPPCHDRSEERGFERPGHGPELLGCLKDKGVILGRLNLDTADHIVARAAPAVVSPDKLRLAPDCGLWFLPRDRAPDKLRTLEEAVRVPRGQGRTFTSEGAAWLPATD